MRLHTQCIYVWNHEFAYPMRLVNLTLIEFIIFELYITGNSVCYYCEILDPHCGATMPPCALGQAKMSHAMMQFCELQGLGLMESGICFMKNEVNILVKNVVDVAIGGFTFWCFGFGLLRKAFFSLCLFTLYQYYQQVWPSGGASLRGKKL